MIGVVSAVASQFGGSSGAVSAVAGWLPSPLSPEGLAFYSLWALFAAAVVNRIRKRRRAGADRVAAAVGVGGAAGSGDAADSERGGGPGGATRGRTSVGTSVAGGDALGEDKPAFVLPASLPLSKGVREVTHNEIHSLELGGVVGFVVSWLLEIGSTSSAVLVVLVFLAGTLGFKRYRTKAFETLRLEPWYALVAFAGGGALGAVVFRTDLLAWLP